MINLAGMRAFQPLMFADETAAATRSCGGLTRLCNRENRHSHTSRNASDQA
jgi:hypothetical protein